MTSHPVEAMMKAERRNGVLYATAISMIEGKCHIDDERLLSHCSPCWLISPTGEIASAGRLAVGQEEEVNVFC